MIFSYERVRSAYTLILHKQGQQLYRSVKDKIKSQLCAQKSNRIQPANDADFLGTLLSAWNDYKVSMVMVSDVLMYLVSFFNSLCVRYITVSLSL
jgi:hypothetical protein